MTARTLLATTTLVVALLGGCKSEKDELEPAVVPRTVSYQGEVDAKYVGNWKGRAGNSTLLLGKDGSLVIESITNSVNGKSKSHIEGMWLADSGDLLFRYKEKSGDETTLKYKADLKGDQLVLQQQGGRLKTEYVRK